MFQSKDFRNASTPLLYTDLSACSPKGVQHAELAFSLAPLCASQEKQRHETLFHSLVRMEVMLPTALAPVPASKTKPPLLNQTEGKDI